MREPHENRGFRVGLPDGLRRKMTPDHGVLGNWGENNLVNSRHATSSRNGRQ